MPLSFRREFRAAMIYRQAVGDLGKNDTFYRIKDRPKNTATQGTQEEKRERKVRVRGASLSFGFYEVLLIKGGGEDPLGISGNRRGQPYVAWTSRMWGSVGIVPSSRPSRPKKQRPAMADRAEETQMIPLD